MTKKTSETAPKWEIESDDSKIIYPQDVEDNRTLKQYFQQRLGPDFDKLSFVLMDRDTYLRLLHGEHALLSKMIAEDEKAANEIFLAFAGDKLNRVIMTFHIESATVGNHAIEFIKKHKSTEEHELWLTQMERLAMKLQKLHHDWKVQSFPYYKIVNYHAKKTS